MRVLITGHEGYIGTVMCEVFATAGHEVLGLDAGLFTDCQLGLPPPGPPVLRIDLRDILASHLDGLDAVVHLAGVSNDAMGDLTPEVTYAVNHRASVRLAKLARDAGVRRFLFASTASVYGAADTDGLVGEDAPLRPVTHYATSKAMVEEDLHALADTTFEPVYLRNATAFGYSARMRGDIVVNDLSAGAYLDGKVRVLSDGTPWRPFAHVRDMATAFLAVLEAPREHVHDAAINIGSEAANVRIAEVAEIVGEIAGADVEITGKTGKDTRSYRVDFSRLTERLPAFRPGWTIERGVIELLEAYRRHGLTVEDLRCRYRRLARLRSLQAVGRVDAELRWTQASHGNSKRIPRLH